MNIVFTPTAWEQYTGWLQEDRKMLKRINDLVKDIERNGFLKGLLFRDFLRVYYDI